jgi:hypothetical protein
MLVIDEGLLARAAEALMICARTAKDQDGLMVSPRLPAASPLPMRIGTADSNVNALAHIWDMPRIEAIALAAVVSLVASPCTISGRVAISPSTISKDTI